jgi:pyruvate,water dikinase
VLVSGGRMTPQEVGGKFHRQNEAIRAGFNVPPFFCLTGAFYDAVFTPLAPAVSRVLERVDHNRAADLHRASGEIGRLFMDVDIPSREQELVRSAVDRSFPEGGLVSVRASIIGFMSDESEDSSRHPFAGMSESFLYVRREDVLASIRRCAASGFSAEAILYRHKQGFAPTAFAVAVGVQKMVFGARSFVLFTCNPNTTARETVIIAGHGIGEGVVQERVPVDHYFSKPGTQEIHRRIAEKDQMLTLAPEGYGLASVNVPAALRAAPCLSDGEVERLAAIGQRIERLFGAPQDIEGTITPDGIIHILQSRPIAIDTRRQRVWTSANVTESFPGVTTPLTYSLARYFYRVIFYDCYRRLGIGPRELHDEHESLDRMIGFLGGRIYYCLTAFYSLHQQSPLFPLFRKHWEDMMGFQSSYAASDEGVLARGARRLRSLLRLIVASAVIGVRFFTHQRDIRRFHEWWERVIAPRRGRDYSQDDPLLAMADFHEIWRQVGNHWGITLMNDTYLPVIYGNIEGLFRRWRLSDTLLSRLLCGDDGLTSVEIVLSTVRLAEYIRADGELSRLFRERTSEELAGLLAAGHLPGEFALRVKSHLHAYGDRGFQELKMEQPSLRDTPWVLFRTLQDYVEREMTAESFQAREREVRAAAERELRQTLHGHPVRQAVLRLGLRHLRRLIRNRENSRYCRSELFSYSRSVFQGLAANLVRDGKLRAAEDAQYLTADEMFGFVDGTGVTENLEALVNLRRAEFRDNKRRETGIELTTWGALRRNNIFHQLDVPGNHGNDNAHELRGLGSSAGRVAGVARVVIDPLEPVDIGADSILIARETDPGWLFLMLSAKAIVVERGSMLSHTAITGRKFGIPTVVAVPGATTRIPDGAWIEVDGGSGVVTILDMETRSERAVR